MGLVLSFDSRAGCEPAHIGTFEHVSEATGKTMIYRTATSQKEVNDTLKYEATFDIKWVDSCTYELSNKKMIKGDSRLSGLPSDILRVQILKMEGNVIYVRVSSNFSDRIMETTMTKME